MVSLIAMGVLAGWTFSVVAVVLPGIVPAGFRDHSGQVAVYFEAGAVIVVLVLLGQMLELRARADGRRDPSAARHGRQDRAGDPAGWPRGGGASRRGACRRPHPHPAGREGAGRWQGPRRALVRRRVDDHGRTDPGREDRRRPPDGRDHQRYRLPGRGWLLRARRDCGCGAVLPGMGDLGPAAGVGLCTGQRGRGSDHRLPARSASPRPCRS